MAVTPAAIAPRTQSAHGAERARGFIEGLEPHPLPIYETVLRRTSIRAGSAVLDIGCGLGIFSHLAAEAGAVACGLDISEEAIALSRVRVPEADLSVGDMECLPYPDRAFDVVAGINSFPYAIDPVAALREARRVSRPGAAVVAVVWGSEVECEAARLLITLDYLLPAPPPSVPGPFALSAPGRLEMVAREAGLAPIERIGIDTFWRYPDQESALRGLLCLGPAVKAIQAVGEAEVRKAIADTIALYRTRSGGYTLFNRFYCLVSTPERRAAYRYST